MSPLVSNDRVPGIPLDKRQMVPGAGLVLAGLASVLLWAVIAAIYALI